jgi:hypothetical protein
VAISVRDLKLLWGRAGGCCSYPGCRRQLAWSSAIVGEAGHIVAESSDGPRGDEPPPGGDREGYANRILVCDDHHAMIDRTPQSFTVAKLIEMKAEHERWVSAQLSKDEKFEGAFAPRPFVAERLYSSLLPALLMPTRVFGIPCTLSESAVRGSIRYPADPGVFVPYVVREDTLYSFCDLTRVDHPFNAICPGRPKTESAESWWKDPDRFRWYITLLNRTIGRLASMLGLLFDQEHGRHYFGPSGGSNPRTVTYKTVSGVRSTRLVAWRPSFRHSGEAKKYWEHLGVGLRFFWAGGKDWCLSIRPERRFTRDGRTPLTAKGTGRRSSNRKSRMYNFDVLKEMGFWREYLSDGQPRITLRFGGQSLVLSTELQTFDVSWPGVPDDAKAVSYQGAEDDLFTSAEFADLMDEAENVAGTGE